MMEAVFFIGFGGPEKREDIRPFLEIVTRGRPIPPERIEEVVHHYEVLGGSSPINAITHAQADGLRAELKKTGDAWPVYEGHRNWHPFIEDTLRRMQTDGVTRAVGFYTAAHRSEASLERYWNAVETARKKIGSGAPIVDFVGPWFDHPLFIDAIAARAREALAGIPESERRTISLIYTAHSIPCCLAKSSTYVIELQKTAGLVTHKLGRDSFRLAYSSRSGNPRDPWLEPDISDEIQAQSKRGEKRVLVIPIGFIADHVEILFDLDVEARRVAQACGVAFHRAQSVGTHPAFIQMIADVVRKRFTQPPIPEMTSSATTRDQEGRVERAPGATSRLCYCHPDAENPPCCGVPAVR
jgi:ferrochelatase